MDGLWFKINDRMINPAHIVDIDLNAQVSGMSSVKITLSATEAELGGAGWLGPKVLTYTGLQAKVLRPFLDKVFPCEMRSFHFPDISDTKDERSASEIWVTCALDTCTSLVENDGEFCSSKCHELYFTNQQTCALDTCNVRVGRNGNFCSDECAELFQEQIPF